MLLKLLKKNRLAGLLALLLLSPFAAGSIPAVHAGATTADLARVTSWHYQLQNIDVDRLADLDVDLLVVDYARTGPDGALRPLGPADVARLQMRPDGRRRIVLAYLSIGEAEDYRFYWRSSFARNPPPWLLKSRKDWPGNYHVRYWHEDWQRILFRAEDSYLARIQEAGFDGVYLDRIDAHQEATGHDEAKEAMLALVEDLAEVARAATPGFLIVAQNGEELLEHESYRGLVDGLAKEDLLTGAEGEGKVNPAPMIAASIAQLNLLKSTGKAVLVAEYPRTTEQLATLAADIAREGFVPLLLTRALDGPSLAPIERPTVVAALIPSSAALGAPAQPLPTTRAVSADRSVQSTQRCKAAAPKSSACREKQTAGKRKPSGRTTG